MVKSLHALGHEAVVMSALPEDGGADVAILNLGSPAFGEMVPRLKELGVFSVGHAGHKEKDLLALGRAAGCDAVATNSELTFKIEDLLKRAANG